MNKPLTKQTFKYREKFIPFIDEIIKFIKEKEIYESHKFLFIFEEQQTKQQPLVNFQLAIKTNKNFQNNIRLLHKENDEHYQLDYMVAQSISRINPNFICLYIEWWNRLDDFFCTFYQNNKDIYNNSFFIIFNRDDFLKG